MTTSPCSLAQFPSSAQPAKMALPVPSSTSKAMETASATKPAYHLYAIAIGGGLLLISLSVLSIAFRVAEVKRDVELRKELIELNWLYTKYDAIREAQSAWRDHAKLYDIKAMSISQMADYDADTVKAKYDAMNVRLAAKYGAEVKLSRFDPQLAAKLIEQDPYIRFVANSSASVLLDQADRDYLDAYKRQDSASIELNDKLRKWFRESVDEAIRAARQEFVKITKTNAADLK